LSQIRADYLVAGAGPAGLTISRLLSLKGSRVVLVDPDLRPAKRLELLAPAALGTVAAVGLSALLTDRAIARPCLGIRRRWNSEPAYEDFLPHPHRSGYVVDRARFDDSLRAAAIAAGVEFVKARVAGVEADESMVCLAVDEGGARRRIRGGTIIDATGRAAVVARRNGARIAIRHCMVAEMLEDTSLNLDTDAPAWLDVLKHDETSWSYIINGPQGHRQVWRIRRAGTGPMGGAILQTDASASILSAMAGEGWMAIGDAASSFDPIASQGLFNALSSAVVAAGALQSSGRPDAGTARLYTDAVTTAFLWSEAGRSNIYGTATA
jgi:flavin-dependent dehydrogenase